MELKSLHFRLGFILDYLQYRLQNHPVYNPQKFAQFHILLKFKPPIFSDNVTL